MATSDKKRLCINFDNYKSDCESMNIREILKNSWTDQKKGKKKRLS